MQLIFFTKFLQALSVEQTGEAVKRLGFDGIDLCLRPGYCVNPENVEAALPPAVEAWRRMGLTCPLANVPLQWADPAHGPLRAIYRACGDAGVPFVRLGYWGWMPGHTHYWDLVDKARRDLEVLAELGRKHNVCTVIHTHSQALAASNASGAMHFVRGFDPKHVAIYLDPAHLACDGEYLPMALDIARGYVRMVAVKNVRYDRLAGSGGGGHAKWKQSWVFLDEGLVDWPETIATLKQSGYDGPLSYHGEVDGYDNAEHIGEAASRDVKFLRAAL